MLNEVFNKVDGLIVKYGLEKIKTIGDGYMAAAGVPEPCADHSVRATNFALDVHIIIAELNKVRETDIRARVGIESGPIVAGVIGKMKFAYDLWGDSVNTASRMESTGKPGFVHISANTKRELESQTDAFEFEELEPMEVKGKGLMLTYMVSRKAGTGVS
jgi:class 3 adenylate cyclase